jgi:hypothetical protein
VIRRPEKGSRPYAYLDHTHYEEPVIRMERMRENSFDSLSDNSGKEYTQLDHW